MKKHKLSNYKYKILKAKKDAIKQRDNGNIKMAGAGEGVKINRINSIFNQADEFLTSLLLISALHRRKK